MVAPIKLAAFVTILLIMLLQSFALAQEINFGVSPAEVRIEDVLPGDTRKFQLTINNKDEVTRVFTLATFQSPEEERRQGRAEFPNHSWISFFPPQITLAAGSQGNVTVTVAIPQEQKWAGRDWEIWLEVTAQSTDLLRVKLYSRLLVSTGGTRFNIGVVAGIAVAIALLAYGGHRYFRHRAKPK
jgi:hypothetical protein